jgi:hypothetical protein
VIVTIVTGALTDAVTRTCQTGRVNPAWTTVVQALPSAGVFGVLLAFIWLLVRREGRVEATHSAALEGQARQHAEELKRLNRDHDAELQELTTKIRDLRRDLDALDRQLSLERAARLGLARRGVETLDLDLDACEVTIRYTDGSEEVKPVSGCADDVGTSSASGTG